MVHTAAFAARIAVALAVAGVVAATPAARAQAPAGGPPPCAGLAIAKLRAPSVPVSDATGAIIASLRKIEGGVLAVRRCDAQGRYVIAWGEGEATVPRALTQVRPRGVRAGESLMVGLGQTRRATPADVTAIAVADANAPPPAQCDSAAGAQRSENDRLFGAMGLSASVCGRPAN